MKFIKRVVINPVTRINGFLEIDAVIDQNIVTNAITEGLLFRGFETMLEGRSPFDAVYFTQRICGICSTAHSVASAMALESAMGLIPSEQGRYLRDIVHACEFLQNHIRHFYQYISPDFVKLPQNNTLFVTDNHDYRLPKESNDRLVTHYFDSLPISRSAHEMLAILGGKAPHNHGVFVGGITGRLTPDSRQKINTLLENIHSFVTNVMIPDAFTISEYYSEYFQLGRGCGNLLSFGCFDRYAQLGTLFVDPLVTTDKGIEPLNPAQITENVHTAWYRSKEQTYTPFETITQPDTKKKDAYSWVKAPRYNGLPYEVGPLARMWLCGDYRNGISMMDRMLARALETKKITEIMRTLLEALEDNIDTQAEYSIPRNAIGEGLVDTTRGALGHWIKIEDAKISFYQLITPSAWNLSTRAEDNIAGPAEQALIGASVKDEQSPVEIGRIVRSFDPCVSCATHVYTAGGQTQTIQVVP